MFSRQPTRMIMPILYSCHINKAIVYRLHSCSQTDDESRGFVYPFPRDMLDIRFMKSTGPGGQNGDSRQTKTNLTVNISNAWWISNRTKASLAQQLDKKGNLSVSDQKSRSQLTNKKACFDKLFSILTQHSLINPQPTEKELAQEKLKAEARKKKWKEIQRTNKYYRDRDDYH